MNIMTAIPAIKEAFNRVASKQTNNRITKEKSNSSGVGGACI